MEVEGKGQKKNQAVLYHANAILASQGTFPCSVAGLSWGIVSPYSLGVQGSTQSLNKSHVPTKGSCTCGFICHQHALVGTRRERSGAGSSEGIAGLSHPWALAASLEEQDRLPRGCEDTDGLACGLVSSSLAAGNHYLGLSPAALPSPGRQTQGPHESGQADRPGSVSLLSQAGKPRTAAHTVWLAGPGLVTGRQAG